MAGPQTGSLGITANLPLSGTGQNGGVSLSTNALSFSAECNTTATPQTFMLNNIGNVPVTWTGVVGKGNQSDFDTSSTGSTIAVGGSITITISPKPKVLGCETLGTFTSSVTSTAPVCHRDIPVSFSIDGIYCNIPQ